MLLLLLSPPCVCVCVHACAQQHDPMSFYAGQEELSPLSLQNQQPMNVHNRVLRLKPDLLVVGFGGSIPVFKDGQQFWWSKPLICICMLFVLYTFHASKECYVISINYVLSYVTVEVVWLARPFHLYTGGDECEGQSSDNSN